MSGKTTAVGIAAREACEKFPDVPNRTLARMLVEQRPKLFRNANQARVAIQRVRGNMGDRERKAIKDKSLFRPLGKAGEFQCPEPIKGARDPLIIDGPCRLGVLSDIHVPYNDRLAVEVAVAHFRKVGVDTLLLNGDTLDFYSISKYETDPEQRDIALEVRKTAELLLWLRTQLPKARLIFKEGNHDERYSLYVWRNAPVLWSLKQCRLPAVLGWELAEATGNESTKLEKYGWEYVTDKRMIIAGDLPILHGHEMKASSGGVSPARSAYLKASHTILIGHLHKTSQHTQSDIFGSECATWSTGCLSLLDPDYMPYGNKWNHGCAFVDIASDGQFNLNNYRIAAGKVRAS